MRYVASKFKVGAPAAMILAAAVTTAVSSETVITPAQPGFSWAVPAGAPLTAKNARAFLAREAANQIRDLDRLSGAAPARMAALEPRAAVVSAEIAGLASAAPHLNHTASTYQHAAP